MTPSWNGLLTKLLTGLVACALTVPALARDYAEIQAEITAARGNIDAAGKSISDSAQSVRQAITTVKSAEHFEGPHWGKLEQAVQNWSTTMEQQGRTIDSNARAILALDPGTSVYLREPDYYGGEMRQLRDQMRQIRADLEAAINRAEQGKERQKGIKKAAVQDIAEGAGNLILNTSADILGIPTSLEDAGGAAVIKAAEMAGKWFAKPLDVANTGVKFVVNFYYLTDEFKSNGQVLKNADEFTAFADAFITRTRADIASAQQGIEIVDRLWQTGDDARSKFNQTQYGWRQASATAAQKQTQENAQAFDQELAKAAPPQGAATYWPAAQTPPIAASEYEPEAEAILRELRSAAMAATDGGSPLPYHEIKRGHLKRLEGQSASAKARLDAAAVPLNQAWEVYSRTVSAAWNALNACNVGCSGIKDYNASNRCWNSCGARYNATTMQAQSALVPAATAYSLAARELQRINLVMWMVQAQGYTLDAMLDTAAQAARSGYYMLRDERQRIFWDDMQSLYSSLSGVPAPYEAEYYRQQPAWIASEMGYWLQDPEAMRNRITDTAANIRAAGLNAKKGIAEYQSRLPKALQAAQQAQAEVMQFLDKSGPLMMIGSNSSEWWTQAKLDEYLGYYRKDAQNAFQVTPLNYLTEVAAFPYEATAQSVEQWLGALDALIGQLDIFNFRLTNANQALHKASQALTHKPAYAQRGEGAQAQASALVLQELTTGPWSGVVAAVDSLPLQDLGLTPAKLAGALPRQRLLTIQSVFSRLAFEQMHDYAAATQRTGGFSLVDSQSYERLAKFWYSLKPLYAQFDAIAGPERTLLTAGQKLLPDESGLIKSYYAIPESRRSLVQERFQRYRAESNWLRAYAALKLDAVNALSDPQTNNVMASLQTLIEGYPAAKLQWEAQQEAARVLYERQMQEYREREAAQEKLRREQEEQARQAAQAAQSSIQKMYQDFAAAYQARNVRSLLRFMADDWKASDGSDQRDLEDVLDNSFRVFDRIVFAVTGLTIQATEQGRYHASYTATITGHINQMNLNHQETAQVQDTVILTPTGPKIQETVGGRIWIKQ